MLLEASCLCACGQQSIVAGGSECASARAGGVIHHCVRLLCAVLYFLEA